MILPQLQLDGHKSVIHNIDTRTIDSESSDVIMFHDFSDLSEAEKKAIYGCFAIYFLCYLSMLFLTLYNSIRYVIPIKLVSLQISSFYALLTLMYMLCVAEYGYYLVKGVRYFEIAHSWDLKFLNFGIVACIISDEFIKIILCILTLTMYHLYLALTQVNRSREMSL